MRENAGWLQRAVSDEFGFSPVQGVYEKDADDAIRGFDRLAAVLGADSDDMGVCYMAEINLGMDGLARHPQRIKDAIGFFRARLDGSRYQLGTVHYTIGNAFHALREEQEAKRAFEAALGHPALGRLPELAAQIHKNLGSSYGLLGEQQKAVDHYREARRLAPDLAAPRVPKSHLASLPQLLPPPVLPGTAYKNAG